MERDENVKRIIIWLWHIGKRNSHSDESDASSEQRVNCGTKPGHFETSIIHFPTSEGLSEVSERANEWAQRRARAKQAVRSKGTSEWCEWTSKRTSEWPSTYFSIPVHSRPQWGGGKVIMTTSVPNGNVILSRPPFSTLLPSSCSTPTSKYLC